MHVSIVHRLRICNNFIFFPFRIICTNIALSAQYFCSLSHTWPASKAISLFPYCSVRYMDGLVNGVLGQKLHTHVVHISVFIYNSANFSLWFGFIWYVNTYTSRTKSVVSSHRQSSFAALHQRQMIKVLLCVCAWCCMAKSRLIFKNFPFNPSLFLCVYLSAHAIKRDSLSATATAEVAAASISTSVNS